MTSQAQDLNLVPYLDILVNLLLFMIVATAYVEQLRVAPVLAPPEGPATAASRPLRVDIRSDGFVVSGLDADLRLDREAGAWPFERLTRELRDLRDGGEARATLLVSAERQIPYSVVVATLDAARGDARGTLFPGVALAVAAR